jgi:hypothetical protein
MSTLDFITELYCRVDEAMIGVRKHSQSKLYPSEIVTLGILFSLKGVRDRAFYRWLKRDIWRSFPSCPSGRACSGCSRRIRLGPTAFWPSQPRWAWPTPMAMKVCSRGTWNVRMVVEAVLSMLTAVCHFKKAGHRAWQHFQARLAFTMAAFNIFPVARTSA